jgi:hypothetical protein
MRCALSRHSLLIDNGSRQRRSRASLGPNRLEYNGGLHHEFRLSALFLSITI